MINRKDILKKFSFSNYAPNFNENDLFLLNCHSAGATFVIETGTGISTHYVADGARPTCNMMYSIDLRLPPEVVRIDWVTYLQGWSLVPEDLPSSSSSGFKKSQYRSPEDLVVFGHVDKMDKDLPDDVLRRIIRENPDRHPDFVFSDGGEYSGYAEWRLLADQIPIGGIWAAHDIYFPKSVKHWQSTMEIETSKSWKVLVKTKSKQGLLIARRISDG